MNNNALHILWTNDNVDTSINMVMMYSKASKTHGFWEDVTVIIWGATAKLVAENKEVRDHIDLARQAGVKFVGCIACAQNLGVVDELTDFGIDLKLMGQPLRELIKNKEYLITV